MWRTQNKQLERSEGRLNSQSQPVGLRTPDLDAHAVDREADRQRGAEFLRARLAAPMGGARSAWPPSQNMPANWPRLAVGWPWAGRGWPGLAQAGLEAGPGAGGRVGNGRGRGPQAMDDMLYGNGNQDSINLGKRHTLQCTMGNLVRPGGHSLQELK